METRTLKQPAHAQARSHALVVVDEVMPGRVFFEAVRKRATEGAIRCTVICTRSEQHQRWLVDEDVAADAARNRLRSTLGHLRDIGLAADGEIGDPDPFFTTTDAVRSHKPDEVVIFAGSNIHSGPLRRGLVERVRSELEQPVTHVVADPEAEAVSGDILVLVAGHVDRDALVESIRERAGKEMGRLTLIFTSGDDGAAWKVADRDMEAALAELQRDWVEVLGQVIHGKALPALRFALHNYPASRILIAADERRLADGSADKVARQAARLTALPIELISIDRGADRGRGSASNDLRTNGSHAND